jgi:hypothetical protein
MTSTDAVPDVAVSAKRSREDNRERTIDDFLDSSVESNQCVNLQFWVVTVQFLPNPDAMTSHHFVMIVMDSVGRTAKMTLPVTTTSVKYYQLITALVESTDFGQCFVMSNVQKVPQKEGFYITSMRGGCDSFSWKADAASGLGVPETVPTKPRVVSGDKALWGYCVLRVAEVSVSEGGKCRTLTVNMMGPDDKLVESSILDYTVVKGDVVVQQGDVIAIANVSCPNGKLQTGSYSFVIKQPIGASMRAKWLRVSTAAMRPVSLPGGVRSLTDALPVPPAQ